MANVCVITGCDGSISLAAAKFISRDKVLVISGRDEARLAAAEAELSALGFDVHRILCDVSSRSDVHELCLLAKSLGTIRNVIHTDGLVPNAAESAERLIRLNAVGTKNVNMEFRKYLERGSVIVDMASCAAYDLPDIAVHRGAYELAEYQEDAFVQKLLSETGYARKDQPGLAYKLSKRFVIWYAQKCAYAYGKDGIRVVSVSPGLIATETGALEAEHAAHMIENSAEHRMGTPEEVGFALATIADERNGFLAGVDVIVDGGGTNGKQFRA
ncbi:MAG: SDR family oxidoreductase [Oscillospiraceae bacterium]|nr:SDR family oxidoreductase [Oscillospiraceae bacterium]